MPDILAIATDYDGTLAENDVVPARTVEALARFKAAGRRLILVTGRHLPELKQVFPHLMLFDVVVAENGGLLYYPQCDTMRLLSPGPSEPFVAALRRRGVDYLEVGHTIVASHIGYHDVIRATVAEMALPVEIILNTDAVMVLPVGTHKASGLAAALAELQLPATAVAGIGDAENDIVFLKLVGHAVAVANALPEVKAIAQTVTASSRGAGVEELIASLLAAPPPA